MTNDINFFESDLISKQESHKSFFYYDFILYLENEKSITKTALEVGRSDINLLDSITAIGNQNANWYNTENLNTIDENDFFDFINLKRCNEPETIDTRSSLENKINRKREEELLKKFTPKFLEAIEDEDFEFGYISKSETIIREQLEINALATRNWLNHIFIRNFHNEKILIGILRILGRFEEKTIFPQGNTMALAALSHKNPEIKELAIRAFENWSSINSLKTLKKIKVKPDWLQEYLVDVISDLESELCLT